MSNTPTITDPTTWALDREIVLGLQTMQKLAHHLGVA